MSSESLDVGTLSGRIELEDKLGPAVAEISSKLDLLNDTMKRSHTSAGEVAEGMFTAEAAMKVAEGAVDLLKKGFEELWDVAIEGSHAADVEDTFKRLTAQAGLTADALKHGMQDALHGTVDDTDIMIRVNSNLAAGLKLTEDQTELLAKGAFALAKATGGNAAEALDKLSDAMVTGRTRSIALLTGKIDLNAAEDAFAAKLGTTADRLSDQGKMAATQEIILKKVAEATERVGDQQVRLADRVQQVKVQLADFLEEWGIAIAKSPVLEAGFEAISETISEAFGADKGELIKTLTGYVEDLAIGTLSLAETVVDAVGVIGVEWNAAIVVFDSVRAGWDAIGYAGESALLAIMKGLNAISFGAFDEDVKILEDDVEGWYNAMAQNQKGIDDHKKAEESWAVATGEVKDKIEEVRQKMIDAKQTTDEETEATDEVAAAYEKAAVASGQYGAAEEKTGLIIGQTRDEAKKYAEALKEMAFVTGDWKTVLDAVDGSVVESVKFYLGAGVALDKLAAAYSLTDTQAASIEKQFKIEQETLKTTIAAIDGLTASWNKYYQERASIGATTEEKINQTRLAEYEDEVKKLQDAGDANSDHYDQLWTLYQKDVEMDLKRLTTEDENSKASLDTRLKQAEATLDRMQAADGNYTSGQIANQRKIVEGLRLQEQQWYATGGAINKTADQVQVLDHAWVTDADIAAATISKTTIMVKTLSGELVTLAEAQKRQQSGGSMTYDLSSQQGLDTYKKMNTAATTTVSDQTLMSLAQKGMTLQQMISAGYINPYGNFGTGTGGIQGFAEGGVGDFGSGTLAVLHGHEAVVPLGKGSDSLGGVTNVFYINGTAADVARQVSAEIMRTLKSQRQFPSA
jgi:hypothetical protein